MVGYLHEDFWKEDSEDESDKDKQSARRIAKKLKKIREKIASDEVAKLDYGIETSEELRKYFLLEMDSQ